MPVSDSFSTDGPWDPSKWTVETAAGGDAYVLDGWGYLPIEDASSVAWVEAISEDHEDQQVTLLWGGYGADDDQGPLRVTLKHQGGRSNPQVGSTGYSFILSNNEVFTY